MVVFSSEDKEDFHPLSKFISNGFEPVLLVTAEVTVIDLLFRERKRVYERIVAE